MVAYTAYHQQLCSLFVSGHACEKHPRLLLFRCNVIVSCDRRPPLYPTSPPRCSNLRGGCAEKMKLFSNSSVRRYEHQAKEEHSPLQYPQLQATTMLLHATRIGDAHHDFCSETPRGGCSCGGETTFGGSNGVAPAVVDFFPKMVRSVLQQANSKSARVYRTA